MATGLRDVASPDGARSRPDLTGWATAWALALKKPANCGPSGIHESLSRERLHLEPDVRTQRKSDQQNRWDLHLCVGCRHQLVRLQGPSGLDVTYTCDSYGRF